MKLTCALISLSICNIARLICIKCYGTKSIGFQGYIHCLYQVIKLPIYLEILKSL